jgi:hypothetical protein
MFRIARIVLSLVAIYIISTMAIYAESTKVRSNKQARLIQEVTALFKVALKENSPYSQTAQKCEYGREWLPSDPTDFASSGFKIPTKLSPAFEGVEPRQVLDPDGNMVQSFCNPEETKKFIDEAVKQFVTGEDKQLDVYSAQFTFPVFWAGYKKAAFVVGQSKLTWWRRASGIVRDRPEAIVNVVLYAKVKGLWQRVSISTMGLT